MPYTAPIGDSVDFSFESLAYTSPVGDAVNFPAPNYFSPWIPYVRGPASGKVSIVGIARGIHTSPKLARFAIASGKIRINGQSIAAVGVAGDMSGRVSPRPSPAPGPRKVPRINPTTGAIEMVDTLPPCVHHQVSQGFQP